MEIGKRKIEVALRVALFWGAFWLLLFGLRRVPVPVAPELGNLLFGCLGTVGAFILVKIFLRAESKTFPDIGLVWAPGSLRRFMLGSAGGMALPLGLHFGLNWMQSLFGMKTQFAGSIWTIVPGAGEGIKSANFIGLILQLLLLAVGILLVERRIRRPSNPQTNSKMAL